MDKEVLKSAGSTNVEHMDRVEGGGGWGIPLPLITLSFPIHRLLQGANESGEDTFSEAGMIKGVEDADEEVGDREEGLQGEECIQGVKKAFPKFVNSLNPTPGDSPDSLSGNEDDCNQKDPEPRVNPEKCSCNMNKNLKCRFRKRIRFRSQCDNKTILLMNLETLRTYV